MLSFGRSIPVTVHPVFFVVAALIGWMASGSFIGMAVWGGVIFISVLCHEFGHALTAVFFGQTARIELMGFGGLTHRRGGKIPLWQEFFVVLNGPTAGVLLGLASYFSYFFLEQSDTLPAQILFVSMYINFFWTFLNLLPIYPLDGGHLMSIVLQGIFGFKGLRYSLFFSMCFGGIVSLCFFALRALLPGAVLLMFAFESYRTWKSTLPISDGDQSESLQNSLKSAEELMVQGRLTQAYEQLAEIRQEASGTGVVYTLATEDQAKILDEWSEYEKAYKLLRSVRTNLSPEGIRLFHQLAYRTEDWENTINMGNQVFQIYPSYDVALINAMAHASSGHVEQAVGWLQRAIKEGASGVKELLQRKEFDPIRQEPVFQSLIGNLGFSTKETGIDK